MNKTKLIKASCILFWISITGLFTTNYGLAGFWTSQVIVTILLLIASIIDSIEY